MGRVSQLILRRGDFTTDITYVAHQWISDMVEQGDASLRLRIVTENAQMHRHRQNVTVRLFGLDSRCTGDGGAEYSEHRYESHYLDWLGRLCSIMNLN